MSDNDIHFKHYEGPQHMELQYKLWEELTKPLPYAWKPTLSPRMFEIDTKFDPRSRIFAYDGDTPIGYIAFSGTGEFVSFGYPWVKKEYEGRLEDELYNRLFEFASGNEYGGKVFAQRFRAQWNKQIDFFLSKGFTVQSKNPIYIAPVKSTRDRTNESDIQITCYPFFNFEQFVQIKGEMTPEERAMLKLYYSSVDFDFSVLCERKGVSLAYIGVTVRKDTGFAEMIASTFNQIADETMISSVMNVVFSQLAVFGATEVGISEFSIPDINLFKKLGFTQKTEDVLVFKYID